MQRELHKAEVFIIGCPACMHNFKEFFCTLFCSPDQATFADVVDVQRAYSNDVTSVKEIQFFLEERYKKDFFGSCKDVIYSASNQKAMTYIGGLATTPQAFLEFLGTVKDRKPFPVGSPIQLDFPVAGNGSVPHGIKPLHSAVPSCWDPAFKCSCGDCPEAPSCAPPPEPPPAPPRPPGCSAVGLGFTPITCTDFTIWFLGGIFKLLLVTSYMRGNFSEHRTPGSLHGSSFLQQPLAGARDTEEREGVGLDAASHFSGDFESDSATDYAFELREREFTAELPWVEAHLSEFFRWLGLLVAQSPLLILLASLIVVAVCMSGLVNMHVVTAPLRLWVESGSQAARDKASYDAAFGPFYRIEQIVLSTPRVPGRKQQPILTRSALDFVFDIHSAIDALAPMDDHERERHFSERAPVTLQSVCYKPFGDVCAVQSVAQYWQMDRGLYDSGHISLDFCLSHWSTSCRSTFEAPMDPKLVLGGFPTDSSFQNYTADTTALLITIPLNATQHKNRKATLWEAAFLDLAESLKRNATELGLTISFSSERSVQDELGRESYTDVSTVALSYLAMFAYIAVAMSNAPPGTSGKAMFVYSRATLGLSGVLIVLCSVLGALGICSMLGIWSTLIIMEVIPFLVLAVGVDNMFILALLSARQPACVALPERMAETLACAGPSILLASASEAVAFGIAATAAMPAVRNFALCAMIAIVLDFCLQVTAFVAFLTLDTLRMERGMLDCLPCVEACPPAAPPLRDFEVASSTPSSPGSVHASFVARLKQNRDHGGLRRFMARHHAPFLARPLVKLCVVLAFTLLTLTSLSLIPHIGIGLDLAVALPRDSYLQTYYRDVLEYARVGPPLMVVVEGMSVGGDSLDWPAICESAGCDDDSVLNQIAAEARRPAESFLATPAASWLDDFLAWVQPELAECCRQHAEDWQPARAGPDDPQPLLVGPEYCPAPDVQPCSEHPSECADCSPCLQQADLVHGWPTLEDTQHLLPWFLRAQPSAACAKGGKGVYTDQLAMDRATGAVKDLDQAGAVTASFRAFSTPLSRQSDFVGALRASRGIVARAQAKLDAVHAAQAAPVSGDLGAPPRVYAYSVFHPFFEQYLTIVGDSARVLSAACAAVFAVTVLLTGSPWLASIIFLCLVLMLVDMLGAMALLGVQLNAISLVNLAMSMGIGVEFLAHIAHSYHLGKGSRDKRVHAAMVDMGASVCAGIMFTKLVGVAVLALSQTQVFEVYYFRMFMALVILGAAHGLLLLPVLLSLIGPPALKTREEHPRQSPAELAPPVTQRTPVFITRSVSSGASLRDTSEGSANSSSRACETS